MGSRSSRLFLVLLHLVVVSRPSRQSNRQPNSLVGGTSTTTMPPYSSESLLPTDSVWIQDSQSRDCLGPTGFSDCGDATQWTLQRITPTPPYRLRMGLFGVKLAETRRRKQQAGWRLCLVEEHDEELTSRRRRKSQRRKQQQACLAAYANNQQVKVEERLWKRNQMESLWRIDTETGSLQSLTAISSDDHIVQLCLWRRTTKTKPDENAAQLILESCDTNELQDYRRVNASLIQYQTVTESPEDDETMPSVMESESLVSRASAPRRQYASHHAHGFPVTYPSLSPRPVPSSPPALPHNHDQAHTSAIEPHDVLPYLNKHVHGQVPQALLKDSNPILLTNRINQQMMDSGKRHKKQPSPSLSPSLSPSPAGLSSRNKIAVHPYLQAAKNEVWKDPATGLEYATDLTTVLNRNRQEYGRHSLMGVGQYVKGFVIKVYGVAFYVSKRDALADPALEPFAGLSADELRQRPDFYKVLRTMGVTTGNFERTLVLKTNMQLSADTMRSSLHADWSQLTDEMKDMLLNSSMEPRPADQEMIEWVQSPDNPSRCSCSSVAPPEYNADPNCCARGTELAFTWLKSGDLEVRMNGRIMDTFPDKDMAEGIFFEYLRMDDPISTDFLNRVVDGFPFLLAPVAQVKGVHIGDGQATGKGHSNPIFKAVFTILDTVQSGSSTAASIIQAQAAPIVAHASQAAKSLVETVKTTYKELDGRKDSFIDQIISFPDFVMSVVSGDIGAPILDTVSDWVTANITPTEDELRIVRRESLGRAFGYPLSRWFSDTYQAPDEIGPMKIDPAMNTTRRLFLAFVHIYLLLLFIVSFPGSYSGRSRLIVRNSMVQLDRADNGSLSSTDESETAEKEFGSVSDMIFDCDDDDDDMHKRGSKRHLTRSRRALRPTQETCDEDLGSRLKKKSLSYFL